MSTRTRYNSNILGWYVKTIVAFTKDDVSDGLTEFVSSISSDQNTKRVVGLDIELAYDFNLCLEGPENESQSVLLKLSTGSCCILIRLEEFTLLPFCLVKFLSLSDFMFVSVNIKFCVELLEKDYGVRIRNAVDLGQLAADVKKEDKFRYCGLAYLALAICNVTMIVKDPIVALSYRWILGKCSEEEAEHAATEPFVTFLVGSRLLCSLS